MEQINFFEEKPLADTSIAELQAMVKQLAEMRVIETDRRGELSDYSTQVEQLEQRILGVLEAHNLKSFKVEGIGNVYTSDKLQVSFPKDPEQAEMLRAFLLKEGLGTALTINHQTLNSMYKARKEELLLQGDIFDFSGVLPGVAEPKVYKTIGFRKG